MKLGAFSISAVKDLAASQLALRSANQGRYLGV
jgi:hypothetical protein